MPIDAPRSCADEHQPQLVGLKFGVASGVGPRPLRLAATAVAALDLGPG